MFLICSAGVNFPGELKLTIEEDVKGYIDELHGSYCTSCPLYSAAEKASISG
jgi:hypothetical protein